MDLFETFTGLYRPSGEEDAVRDAIEDMVRRTSSQWPAGSVSTARDDAGNLLVRLPGTGRFSSLTKPIVLQAHMDMVLAVEGAKPGEDLRPYFRQGVKTEVVTIDGQQWIRSLGARTSLGADNALGMAVAARYLADPSLEHPPLELVFTTREEVGLVGARQMRLPLAGRVLFNFDSPGARTVTRGCMGSSGAFMAGTGPTAEADADSTRMQLDLRGLRGGHAGRDAHRRRLNAAMAAAELIKVAARFGGRLVSVVSGDGKVFNKINDAFAMTLVVPKENAEVALSEMRNKLAALVAARDEDPSMVKLTATLTEVTAAKAFTAEATRRLGDALAGLPDGLLDADPAYPDTVKVSSNFAFFKADAGDGSIGTVYSARTFTAADTTTWATRIETAIRGAFDVTRTQRDAVAPWLLDGDHWLVRAALALGRQHFASVALLPATIECGAIAALYEGMAAISLGTDLVDNHTPRERMRRDGLVELATSTQLLIESIGERMLREA